MEIRITEIRFDKVTTLLSIDKRVVRIINVLTYSLLLFSVVTKLFCIPYISHKFHLLGISDYCHLFALIEFVGIAFFSYKSTLGLGLILLCSYFGGAIATDIHAPEYIYQPVIVVFFILLTSFVRKPSIFHERLTMDKENNRTVIRLRNQQSKLFT